MTTKPKFGRRGANLPIRKPELLYYEIEGYYPVGHVAHLMRTDPTTWHREWRTWHTTTDLREARLTLRTGNYLRHRTCPISYTMLRIVRVTDRYRKVIK